VFTAPWDASTHESLRIWVNMVKESETCPGQVRWQERRLCGLQLTVEFPCYLSQAACRASTSIKVRRDQHCHNIGVS
jgi:hypothetical protein